MAMLSNSELFAQHGVIPERRSADRRVEYVVFNPTRDRWLNEDGEWVAREHAHRHKSMTAALGHAVMTWDLVPDTFTVEAV